MRSVQLEARAKINLGLAVGPRRKDGFHDLVTLFQSVTLADTLRIARRRRGFTLTVRTEDASRGVRVGRRARRSRPATSGAARVPRDSANLVLRAARRLAMEAELSGGAHFTLVKRIPSGAGLGGGSADAAAALLGLRRLYAVRLARRRWIEIAAELGSDVPFALTGGTALGLGRGERLTSLRLAEPFRVLIAVPRWATSTAQAFARLDSARNGLTGWRAKLRFAASIGREEITLARAFRLANDLESALGTHQAEFQSLVARLNDLGVRRVRLTGSGSAAFGILGPNVTPAEIRRRFVGDERLFVARTAARGVRIAATP